jgi:hypothetical protein
MSFGENLGAFRYLPKLLLNFNRGSLEALEKEYFATGDRCLCSCTQFPFHEKLLEFLEYQ